MKKQIWASYSVDTMALSWRYSNQSIKMTSQLHLLPRLTTSGPTSLLPLHTLISQTGVTSPFYIHELWSRQSIKTPADPAPQWRIPCAAVASTSSCDPKLQPFSNCLRGQNMWQSMAKSLDCVEKDRPKRRHMRQNRYRWQSCAESCSSTYPQYSL